MGESLKSKRSKRKPSLAASRKKLHAAVKAVPKRVRRNSLIFSGILLLVLILYFMFGLQVQIILSEEMDLDLSPNEKSFTVSYDDVPVAEFDLVVKNPSSCSFECVHELKDLGTNEILVSKSSDDDKYSFSQELPLGVRGEGQKIFLYYVTCHNKRSSFCKTDEAEYVKSALVTVNYGLPESESVLRDDLEVSFAKYLSLLENASSYASFNRELAKLLSLNVSSVLQDDVSSYMQTASRYRNLWENSLYVELAEEFDVVELKTLNSTAQSLLDESLSLLAIASNYSDSLSLLRGFADIDSLSEMNDVLSGSDHNFSEFLILLNETIDYLYVQNFSYDEFFLRVDDLTVLYNTSLFEFGLLQNDLSLEVSSFIDRYEFYFSKLSIPVSFSGRSSCDVLNEINDIVAIHNSRAKEAFSFLFEGVSPAVQDDLSKTYISWLDELVLDNSSELNLSAFENISSGSSQVNFSEFVSFLPEIVLLDKFVFDHCSRNITLLDVPVIRAQEIIVPELLTYDSVELSSPDSLCCFDGDCAACCTSDTCNDLYPVVFVHGHAISSGNLPEESHSQFARMQKLLELDGYVNAGEIGEGSEFVIPGGDWGRMIAPLTVRVSYYFISYFDVGSYHIKTQRTDSIENYAIRLREQIDLVKYRTGRDKVDIVAHSMGGLVVRQYISLFGEDSVNKLVILGTPNKGTRGRVDFLCPVTGASRECSEMSSDSVFMKRINSPENDFKDIEGYTVIARGCDMQGYDGDGIVRAEDVYLNFTKNIYVDGNCTDFLQSNLHTRFINPELYPETFEIIRSVLLG